ncbi:tetratricopeptide repeat protein [Kitasatospora sp. P5_F3]
MRRLPLLLTTAALCGCLAFAALGREDGAAPSAAPPTGASVVSDGNLERVISATRQRLRQLPGDHAAWALLGGTYVEQARLTSDPSSYPKAEEALRRSLTLAPEANADALTGLGALANARHRFAEAKEFADRAIAVSPYHWQAYAVLADAQTQLGNESEATAAVQALLDRHPGTAAFTRAAYDLEQHGQTDRAGQALRQALAGAANDADRAFCHHQLAELEQNSGHPQAALEGYRQALAADPQYTPALAGRARAEAALGDTEAALRDYTSAVAKVPLPQYLLELGELYESLGRGEQAGQQYELLAAEHRLAAGSGVVDDLALGQYLADHGDPTEAVRLLRAEWQRRRSVLVADALAWALHRQGADQEALGLAGQARRTGWPNARFRYHQGEIERSLGQREAVRTHLGEAVRIDPYLAPARAALDSLGGP